MLFVTATDTDVGKTFFSKSLIKFLIKKKIFTKSEIAYFKPIQCGLVTDFDEVKKDCGVDVYCSYFLKFPASPDYAARLEGIKISLEKIVADFKALKKKYKYIIVEGAGGVCVPINEEELISALIKKLKLEAVLIIRPDLGTINHSIACFEHLKNKKIKIKGFFVSAKSRDISKSYKLSTKEKSKQNSAALESIIKFTKLRNLTLEDFQEKY